MPALRRRYRAFLLIALLFTITLYHLRRLQAGNAQSSGFGPSNDLGHQFESTTSVIPSATSSRSLDTPSASLATLDATPPPPVSEPPTLAQLDATLVYDATLVDDLDASPTFQISAEDAQNASDDHFEKSEPAETASDGPLIEDLLSNNFEHDDQDRWEANEQSPSPERPHWQRQEERFPVPASEIIPLPNGPPRKIPVVQHNFMPATQDEEQANQRRLKEIRNAFQHAWGGYKNYAMPHDELLPVSKDFKDPFGGWGATLVDTLDTLWIMGLKDEFEEAVGVVGRIDFTTSTRSNIPLFETVIRFLGGLIGAYDVSSGNYQVLLDKALELVEILMGAFDTPNRMPVTYYGWAPSSASQPHRASNNAVLAEIGSLSLEFTRLAQITHQDKYYDAVARITNALEKWQNNTDLPGLWPTFVDASECERRDQSLLQDVDSELGNPESPTPIVSQSAVGITDDSQRDKSRPAIGSRGSPQPGAVRERQIDGPEDVLAEDLDVLDTVCQAPELNSPRGRHRERFTLGALSDSTYEYLPKEWLLLGGLNPQYQSMYQHAVAVARDTLLYRPMTKTQRSIRFSGTWEINRRSESQSEAQSLEEKLDFDGEHLTCFAGGMFALGAKIFGMDADLQVAQQLTDGCIWAYESTATGIMPESFHLVPCESDQQCLWNETRWWEFLDPDRSAREARAKTWLEQQQHPAHTESESRDEDSFSNETWSLATDVDAPDKAHHPIEKVDYTEELRSAEKPRRREAVDLSETLDGNFDPLTEPTGTQSVQAKLESEDETAGRSEAPPSVFTPAFVVTHENWVQSRIEDERLPQGFSQIDAKQYILRPEAIESVFIMYRVTGDKYWQDKGWKMFTAIQASTKTAYGNSAINDVTRDDPSQSNSMESFWLAETLKYFYLLYSDPSLISLDEFVLNTEAHPFRRPT